MSKIQLLVGPFERQAFADGLVRMLSDEPDFEVSTVDDEGHIAALMTSQTPLVALVEARAGVDHGALRPRSDCVALILVSSVEPDFQIALRQLDPNRLRAAIRLAIGTPPPRIIALNPHPTGQSPGLLSDFARSDVAGLSALIGWLNGHFACALADLAAERGEEAGPGWLGELNHVVAGLGHGEPDFAALMATAGWRCRHSASALHPARRLSS